MKKEIRTFLGYVRRLPYRVYRDLKYIKKLKNERTNDRSIYYFGVPEHSNLGDLAQCYCIRNYLKADFSEYRLVEIPSRYYLDNTFGCRDFLKTEIGTEDLIVFQSGYCTQDIGGREDLMHQMVIKDFPTNRLLMLPQTVYFKSEERRNRASEVYGSHEKLMFLARDTVSYELSKKMFPEIEVYEYPDIVTTLIGRYNFQYERNGILFCIRDDAEKFYSDNEIAMLMEKLHTISEKIDKLDTTIKEEYYVILRELKKYIEAYFEKFAKYRLVITDRYHGTIFSLIANTPVIVLKTNDHKVKTGVNWFNGVYDNSVFYAETLDEAYVLAQKILNGSPTSKNEPYFYEKYYSNLKDKFINQ